ncbi:hypothetical protein [Lysobacter claricitrinus]|uniref:hypothetical protein n=1 Tax=Lysobacter claricitrinus TaxID=3367728 RepID=UPI0037DAFF4A
MFQPSTASIPSLLVRDLPRELVMGVEDALRQGAYRAYGAAHGRENGHLPNVLGQLRHFDMNEGFHRALAAAHAQPTELRGNDLVLGRAGIFTLGRFNITSGCWLNGRRSHTRRHLALANQALEPLVQNVLFDQYREPPVAVAFFVACFSGSPRVQPEAPVSISVAVPDRDMRGWLFRESISTFLERYEPQVGEQVDLAKPKLRQGRLQGRGGESS